MGDSFAAALRRHRAEARLTQEQLAELAGLSLKAVSALERGERQHPYPHTVRALASALRLTAEEGSSFEALARRRPAPALPAAPANLVGRETEVRELSSLLAKPEVRLLTLIGPGGVGKTRLALAVAEAVAPGFMDGATFVPLASVREPAVVLSTVAAALGLREAGERPLRELLHDYVRSREILLVLDNLEHLLDAAADLADLLEAGGRLVVLATSRSPLRLRAEWLFSVRPLQLAAAVELFQQRATQTLGEPLQEDAEVVANVCRRLDGLPLAIELAAARTRVLSTNALLSQLGRALSVLSNGPRDLPERQQTLRKAIAWSHDLLSSEEQVLFRRLGVFTGSWTLEAAAAVTGVDETQVLELHERLLDNHLISSDRRSAETRFSMLETIRAYATEKLEAQNELETTRQLHARYYRNLVWAAGDQPLSAIQPTWFDLLQVEDDNLRAMLDWLLERGDGISLARVCDALFMFWSIRGRLSEGEQRIAAALRLPGLFEEPRARLLGALAFMLTTRGSYDQAGILSEEAGRLARAAGNLHLLANVLTANGFLEVFQGRTHLAERHLQDSLSIAREQDDPWCATMARIGQAHLAISMARLAEADGLLTDTEAEIRQIRAPWNLAVALSVHARAKFMQGDYTQAELLAQEAAGILARFEDVLSLPVVLLLLASSATMRSRPRRAARLFGAADELMERTGVAIYPVYRDLIDRCRAAAHKHLGDSLFEALRQEGRASSTDELMTIEAGTG